MLKTKTLTKALLMMLLLVFTVKPAVKLCLHVFDHKTELFEWAENDAEEEEVDDVEEGDQLIHHSKPFFGTALQKKSGRSLFQYALCSEFDPAVVLPPPELILA